MRTPRILSGIATCVLIAAVTTSLYQRAEGGGASPSNPPQTRHMLVPTGPAIYPGSLKSVPGPGYLATQAYTRLWRNEVLERLTDEEIQFNMALLAAGRPTTEHPAVGLLLEIVPGQPPVPLCTGTLVDSKTFLTAAHCVINRRTSSYAVFFQHAGLVKVADDGITTYCDEHAC